MKVTPDRRLCEVALIDLQNTWSQVYFENKCLTIELITIVPVKSFNDLSQTEFLDSKVHESLRV